MDCTNETLAYWTNMTSSSWTEGSETVQAVKYYVMDLAVPVISVLGLLGNLLALLVLTLDKLQRTMTKMEVSAHIGLMALAVSDFLFCLLVLIFTQVNVKTVYQPADSTIYFAFVANGLITLFIITSTWLIVVMAAERYIAVCHPFQARELISLRRTRASVVTVFIVCSLSTIPIFLERTLKEVTCPDGRQLILIVERSAVFVSVRRIMWAIVYDFIPSAALVYFNLRLIVQIRRAKHLRDQMTPIHSLILRSSTCSKTSLHRHECEQSPPANHQRTTTFSPLLQKTLSREDSSKTFTKRDHSDRNQTGNGTVVSEYTSVQPLYSNGSSPDSNQIRNPGNSFKAGTEPTHQQIQDWSVGRRLHSCNHLSRVVNKRRPPDTALNNVTATLVSVVLVFLILVSPSEMMKFSVGFTSAGSDHKLVVTYITNFMQVLNFSLNFVLYCAVNKTFRQTFRTLVCGCWCRTSRS